MRGVIVLAGLLIAGPACAGGDNMAGWYLAMVEPDGTPTINSSPFASEAACRQQLADLRKAFPRLLEECVDLEAKR